MRTANTIAALRPERRQGRGAKLTNGLYNNAYKKKCLTRTAQLVHIPADLDFYPKSSKI